MVRHGHARFLDTFDNPMIGNLTYGLTLKVTFGYETVT